ncbi:hypothetical protein Calkr_2555 [Caldicellulosiruptor acetigenus I77R1B]|uniref:SLH domain-containing protein n=1 Tax=Caldicellulosiruptor acetigenus (strain ATCC 700853 / DSM 12137 / I77R1B) TaxID=632335 RepID=E4S8X5_CALA7|nr:hypothetical protein [Caldicellulosiruptor acetigenus]ADQ41980.1 hypothetical protein Calkr_2555 [Caldicellulosiruptor acetigenus I77R1B]
MKKRLISFLLLVFFLLIFEGSAYSGTKQIANIVSKDYSDYQKILWVVSHGYMSLISGNFMPESYVKRRHFAKVLIKLSGDIANLANPEKSTFVDVLKTDFRNYETGNTASSRILCGLIYVLSFRIFIPSILHNYKIFIF